MRRLICFIAVLSLVGCTGAPPEQAKKPAPTASTPETKQADPEAEIRDALAKLSPEDRKLAEAQRWCAVTRKSRLGSMDTPYKVMINGQPVFLCCEGCKKDAERNPEKTLADVALLKEKAAKAQ